MGPEHVSRHPLLLAILPLLPASLALAGWWKLRQQLYLTHWGKGPQIFLLVIASVALLLAIPRVARLVRPQGGALAAAEAPSGSRRWSGWLTAALAVFALWALTDEVRELRSNLAVENAKLIDIGDATWAAAVRFFDLGQNPYTHRTQLQAVTGLGVTERDGHVEMFGVEYFYGFAYFPAMFLSYQPFRFIDGGRQSIRIGNAFWLAALVVGCAWLAYRLAPEGRRPQSAALAVVLLAITSGLGRQLYFGITDEVIAVYVVLALVATTYRRHLVAGALMGLAFSAKLLPTALLAALFFAWLLRRGGFREALAGFVTVSAAVFLPFVLWHPGGFVSATFLFYATHHVGGDTTSLWYFLPTGLRFPFQVVGGLAVLALLSTLRSTSDDARDLVRAMVVATFVFLAFSPMIHLNYQFAVVPLACVALATDAMGEGRLWRHAAATAPGAAAAAQTRA